MDQSTFAAMLANAAIKGGVSTERIGLTLASNSGRWAMTTKCPAKLVENPPAGTAYLGSRYPDGLVCTIMGCIRSSRKVYCVNDGLNTFKIYW